MKEIRTRFAPSPTGYLHIGGLRSALFCYAWAKKHNGSFILRIEDTDQNRLVEGAIEQIIRSLKWAGITPDEGVIDAKDGKIIQSGDKGPYIQSERLDLYTKFAQQLLDEKKAYKCWCSSERLTQMRDVQKAAKQMPKYDRLCYHLSDEEKKNREESGDNYVIRFFVPEKDKISWDDAVFGKMEFGGDQVDDFVMIKADKFPTYNFANVIDDHGMEISHIIRGQEFLSSTPKHILLYEAFGWEIPKMVHVAWILGKNKQKLSKRDGDVSVDDYLLKGFLPEALVNYLGLLGWNPGGDLEIFDMETMIDKFELKDVQKSGAVFDLEKLEWMNGQYIRKMTSMEFASASLPFLIKGGLGDATEDIENLTPIVATEQGRVKRLDELADKIRFFYVDKLEYEKELLVWKKGKIEDVKPALEEVVEKLNNLGNWQQKDIKQSLMSIVEGSDWKTGDIFWPARVALSGQAQSPGPDEIAFALGKEKTIERLMNAITIVG